MDALIPKQFDDTLGALLLGGLFAMALWGVTCAQTFRYFTKESRDWVWMKTIIGFLWALDTFDSALNIHILYYYMVSNYMNIFALFKPTWSIMIHVAITSTSNFIIRAMFLHRVWRFSEGNFVLTGGLMSLSLGDLVVGYVITVKAFALTSFLELEKLSNLMYLTFALGTGSDVALAATLCWYLRSAKTGFHKTDTMIGTLMAYSVYTGGLVAVDASLGLILYAVRPKDFIFLSFYLLLSKLYLNSYLASLNAREMIRERKDEVVSIHLSDISGTRRYDLESMGMNTTGSRVTSEKTTRGSLDPAKSSLAITVQTIVDTHDDGTPIKESMPEGRPF